MRRGMSQEVVPRWTPIEPVWATVITLSLAGHLALGVSLYFTPAHAEAFADEHERLATLVELRWPAPERSPAEPRTRRPERAATVIQPALAPVRLPPRRGQKQRPAAPVGAGSTTQLRRQEALLPAGGLSRDAAAGEVLSRLPARPIEGVGTHALPSVAVTEPTAATGCMTAQQLEPALARLHHKAQRCYVRRLALRSSLAGTVVTTVVIDDGGVVRDAYVAHSTLDDPEVGACLIELLSTAQFPACDGGVAQVTQPWTFSPRR